jgi:hypothetical protein
MQVQLLPSPLWFVCAVLFLGVVTMKHLREIDLAVQQSQLVLVNAEDAAWALAKNTNNRHLASTVWRDYMRAMQRGDWLDNHPDPLIFDGSGNLMNGQHRLQAILECGDKTYVMIVRTQESKAAIMTIDYGARRKPSDQLRIYSGLIVRNGLIAAVRLWDVEANTITQYASRAAKKMSAQEYLEKSETYGKEVAIVSQLFGRSRNLVGVSGVGCAMLVGAKINPTKTAEFITHLTNPACTVSQASMLRSWLARPSKGASSRLASNVDIFAHACHALWCFLMNVEFTRWPINLKTTIGEECSND